jgi:uncharacterized protein Yka (UPF0111/DUF47 family)
LDTSELTIEILKGIRDEVKATNGRLDAMNGRIDTTNGRLDALHQTTDIRFQELTRRIVESEVRTSTAITDLRGTMEQVVTLLLRPRVERCEQEIDALKRVVER